jgi:hypothetical protein
VPAPWITLPLLVRSGHASSCKPGAQAAETGQHRPRPAEASAWLHLLQRQQRRRPHELWTNPVAAAFLCRRSGGGLSLSRGGGSGDRRPREARRSPKGGTSDDPSASPCCLRKCDLRHRVAVTYPLERTIPIVAAAAEIRVGVHAAAGEGPVQLAQATARAESSPPLASRQRRCHNEHNIAGTTVSWTLTLTGH